MENMYIEEMMEQLNSGELKVIFRNISRIVLIGLTTGGRKAWQEEDEFRNNLVPPNSSKSFRTQSC